MCTYMYIRVCVIIIIYSSICPKAVCLCVSSEGVLLEKWAPLNGAYDNS